MQYAINNRGNQQQNHQNADEYTGPGLDPNSIDAVLSEFQSLRTKYDKVVELTVNLQAEKDTMDERLRAKIEERKDINQKKDRERKGAKALANSHKRRGTFSYMFLIITAVLAYALGYYLEHRKIWSFTSTATEGDAAEEL
jgi:hypothetical protein